jgi:hypothetical protein
MGCEVGVDFEFAYDTLVYMVSELRILVAMYNRLTPCVFKCVPRKMCSLKFIISKRLN